MLLRLICALCALFLLAPVLLARPKRDIPYFKNGDRMTCEIKSLGNGRLTVSVDYIDGSIPVDWSLVERVESDQAFIVEMLSGDILTGLVQAVPGADPRSPTILVTSPQEFRQVRPWMSR